MFDLNAWRARSAQRWRENRRDKLKAEGPKRLASRSPIAKVGPRLKSYKKQDEAARAECLARGRCQAQGFEIECFGRHVWAHIITRACILLRWEPDNCLCLCLGHEMYFTGNRKVFKDWVNSTFDGLYDKLKARSNGVEMGENPHVDNVDEGEAA